MFQCGEAQNFFWDELLFRYFFLDVNWDGTGGKVEAAGKTFSSRLPFLAQTYEKTLPSSFPGVFAYHSTTVYRSFVQKTLLSSIPGVFTSHSTTVYRSNVHKTLASSFAGCSFIIRRPLSVKHTNTVGFLLCWIATNWKFCPLFASPLWVGISDCIGTIIKHVRKTSRYHIS